MPKCQLFKGGRSMSRFFVALPAMLLAVAPASSFAQQPSQCHGPHMWDGGWWMFFGPLWMILVIGALVAGVVLLVRWLGVAGPRTGAGQATGDRALDILKERYAKGEIDTKEFEERRRILGE